MIVTRAPLRVSFMGGGTDLPAFYRQEEGCVLSTSIQRYVYICLNKKFDDSIRVSYSQNEFCNSVDEIKHDLVRESLRFMGVEKGVEITSVSDIPSNGSGMGSSSAFTVALLTALAEYTKRGWTKEWLASTACDIEINCCGKPIGKQDQYASAIGGMNFIRFKPNESVESSPLWIRGAVRRELGRKLLLLHTGQSRKAEAILAAQSAHTGNDPETRRRLREMVILAQVMRDQIEAGNLSDFGRLLNAGWQLKQNQKISFGWY